jgi:hypothetical protein
MVRICIFVHHLLTKKSMKKIALLLFTSIVVFGCGSSNAEKSESTVRVSSTDQVCEMCGKSFSGLGWFDDSETGWRPAGNNDLIIKNICSKECGKQYNRKDGDKPDNWSTKH